MKIFASWSGQQSKQVAEALKNWFPSVLQTVDVFMSAQDIQSGERGLNTIAENLSQRGYGILVLTKTNFNAPWVLFEAGALSNTMPGRVAPLMCDMGELDLVKSPLNQFQHNKFDKEGVLKLVKDVNNASETVIDEGRLQATFEKWWPDLESKYREIPGDSTKTASKNSTNDENFGAALAQIIAEIQKQGRRQAQFSVTLSELFERLNLPRGSFLA
ncbi:hypothetical protein ACVDG5_022390 [Mesorhizobium sp. ORM6]